MQVLTYHRLDTSRIPNFAKVKSHLEAGDFRSAQTRKVGDNLFRARLDGSNRLLFSFARYRGQGVVLILEFIANHAYDKSRFLAGGATVDDNRLPEIGGDDVTAGATDLAYVNPRRASFNLLDKVISFDDAQHDVFALRPPLIVIGSAGSGKTVLTLEKMKEAVGDVLYVTRSPYLVDSSRETYYGMNYLNDAQDVSFLSYAEFMDSIRVAGTREVAYIDFARWFSRHRAGSGLKDPHQLFEEINGVITGSTVDGPWLERDDYLALGVRQSIYARTDRERVYDLFTKYREHLEGAERHDVNILSYRYQSLVETTWDFVVVDEVQDFTTVQLDLVLRTLKEPHNFILCGDANQIVHPNFFSWSALKRHFYEQTDAGSPADLMRILNTNYRNSRQVTEVANRILRLKHARFRSVDKESNHLVRSNAGTEGSVLLLANEPAVTRELDEKTHDSIRYAVIVMHAEQKWKARERFRTPLVFSIQEAKGLEYDNVILYDFVSGDESRFQEIVRGVAPEQVQQGELRFARARDKSDKSLEIFKFHINALYVAATRAVRNVYLVEPKPEQRLFALLGIERFSGKLDLAAQVSSLADWQREAQKLERQGKDEQAQEIRTRILGVQDVPWEPLTRERATQLAEQAFNGGGRKTMLQLFEHALLDRDEVRIRKLADNGFRPARQPRDAAMKKLIGNHYTGYTFRRPDAVRTLAARYGVDHRDRFNWTPLMLAARFGNEAAVSMLADMGANPSLVNSAGLTAYQIMLAEASTTPRYATRSVPGLYRRLVPASFSVQIDDRLVKLQAHQAEFLFCNLFVALFHSRWVDNASTGKLGLRAADLEAVLKLLPSVAVPPYRTKRAYITGVLATNEMNRPPQGNRRLFKRTSRGFYILNPDLKIRSGTGWLSIYDLLEPQALFLGLRLSGRVPTQFRAMIERDQRVFQEQCLAMLRPSKEHGSPPAARN